MRQVIRSAVWAMLLLTVGSTVSDVATAQQRSGSRPSIPVRMVRPTASPITIVIVGPSMPAGRGVTLQPTTERLAPRQGTHAAPTPATAAPLMSTATPSNSMRIPIRATSSEGAAAPMTRGATDRAATVDLFAGPPSASEPGYASPPAGDAQLAGVREYLDGSAGTTAAPVATGPSGAVNIRLDSGVSVDSMTPATTASVPPSTAGPSSYDRGYSPPATTSRPAAATAHAGSVDLQSAARSADVTDGNYLLGPGDVVDVFVWRNAELSRTVPVRPDGYISLPLVGEIVAAGKTAAQLEGEITSALAGYIQVPTVTITVTQIRSLVIYVLGRVSKPGPLTLERNVDVVQAIAMAGGVTEFADKNGVHVIRTIRGRRTRIPFPYGDVLKGKEDGTAVVLQAGDVIYVP